MMREIHQVFVYTLIFNKFIVAEALKFRYLR